MQIGMKRWGSWLIYCGARFQYPASAKQRLSLNEEVCCGEFQGLSLFATSIGW